MSTRIRYEESEIGSSLKKSKKPFRAGKKSYYVVLNEEGMHYIIFDSETKDVVASGGNTTNKAVLRLQAKKALEQLGVKFEEENRKQRRTIPEPQVDTPAPTAQPETDNVSHFVRRDEVMALIETKLKEVLGIIEQSKPTRNETFQENQNELVG